MAKVLLLVCVDTDTMQSAGNGDPRTWKHEDFQQLGIPYENVTVFDVENNHGLRLRLDEDEHSGFTEV